VREASAAAFGAAPQAESVARPPQEAETPEATTQDVEPEASAAADDEERT
jgi:hypothetical protein